MRALAFLVLLQAPGCAAPPDFRLISGRPRAMIHRGSTGPEGTIEGCERSLAQGIFFLELDVRLTSDGHAVILHDATVDRTTDGRGPVARMTLAELRRLDAGAKVKSGGFAGARIPTVEELLRATKGRAWVTLELKVPEAAAATLAAIRGTGTLDRAVVRSADLLLLGRLRQEEPRLLTGAMAPYPEDLDGLIAKLRALGVAAFTPRSNAPVTRDGVARFQRAGIAFWATLANDRAGMRRMIEAGVDGIITDEPEVLLAELNP
jgi:glycerophosphoryl diester phosphodiesterase